MSSLAAILGRELRLSFRQGMDSLMAVVFFVIAVVLFPLGVGPEANTLARIAAGTIWVAALLAAMLSLERLYQHDHEDGSLDLLVVSAVPLELVVVAKIAAHWLTTGVPLIAAAPLLALFLNMHTDGLAALLAALALGTPTLSLIGGVGAALTLGARRGGVLLSLLVLPLFIPVLIFGVGAVDAALQGFPAKGPFLILGGLFLGSLALAPFAAAAALRQAVD